MAASAKRRRIGSLCTPKKGGNSIALGELNSLSQMPIQHPAHLHSRWTVQSLSIADKAPRAQRTETGARTWYHGKESPTDRDNNTARNTATTACSTPMCSRSPTAPTSPILQQEVYQEDTPTRPLLKTRTTRSEAIVATSSAAPWSRRGGYAVLPDWIALDLDWGYMGEGALGLGGFEEGEEDGRRREHGCYGRYEREES